MSEFKFAPGCALMIYKPELAEKLLPVLNKTLGKTDMHLDCCQHEPNLKNATQIINICPGCDKRSSGIILRNIKSQKTYYMKPTC